MNWATSKVRLAELTNKKLADLLIEHGRPVEIEPVILPFSQPVCSLCDCKMVKGKCPNCEPKAA